MEPRRSVFGPFVLIAAGVLWLLIRSGNVPSGNLWALTHIWPFLLIAAGMGLMLRPYWEYASVVLEVSTLGGVVLAVVFAPSLGWQRPSMLSVFQLSDSFIGPGLRGSGNVITQPRQLSGFDVVELDYPARVSITQGNTESVSIEAEENLLPELKTEVQDGALKISYRKTGDPYIIPTKAVIITITVRDLTEVDFSSAGEVIIEGVETDHLTVALNGAGNLELNNLQVKHLGVELSGAGSMSASGRSDDLEVSISGFGDFKGADLHTRTAAVEISGAGGATVWVDDQLDAQISGAGSVNYYGSADVVKQIDGIGGVNHQGDK